MKHIILVDTENVGSEALEGLNCLEGLDVQIIFFAGVHSKPIPATFLFELQKLGAGLVWELVEEGMREKNNMDFHIMIYLTNHIRDYIEEEYTYFVLSKDLGFVNPTKYLSKRFNKKITNIPNLSQILSCNKISDAQKVMNQIIDECKRNSENAGAFHRNLQLKLNDRFTTNQIAEFYWQHKEDYLQNYFLSNQLKKLS